MSEQIRENNCQIRTGNASLLGLYGMVRDGWLHKFFSDVQSFMQNIVSIASSTSLIVKEIQGRLPSHLERCLYQEPFIFKDAHGRQSPIYMDCITSWDHFDAWLEVQFRGLPCDHMVQKRDFVLHETSTKKDIKRHHQWNNALLPGQRIVMCMIFYEYVGLRLCPKHSLESLSPDWLEWWVNLSFVFLGS